MPGPQKAQNDLVAAMNKPEPDAIADGWLNRLRGKPYGTLAARVGQPPVTEAVSRNGVGYQAQVLYHWDDKPGGNVRVIVAIDDGGLQAFLPITTDFIKSSSEQFIGE